MEEAKLLKREGQRGKKETMCFFLCYKMSSGLLWDLNVFHPKYFKHILDIPPRHKHSQFD